MAYVITKRTRFGTDATYWKISDLRIDLDSKAVTFTINGWASQALRNDVTAAPLESYAYTFTADRFPALLTIGTRTVDQIVGALYNRVRELYPEWANATDG
jgi:hypothetical protein